MLILTRKPGESVMIEESVRITVLEVRGSQVKLGIQAPLDVRVNREEVLERQRAEAGLPPIPDLPLPPVPAREAAHAGRGRSQEERRPAASNRNEVPRHHGRPGRAVTARGLESPARGLESPPRGGRSDRDSHLDPAGHSRRSASPDRSGRREEGARPSSAPAPRSRNGGPPDRDPVRPHQDDRFHLRRPARSRPETPALGNSDEAEAPAVRRYRSPDGPRPHRAGRLSERLASSPPPAEPGLEPGEDSLAPLAPEVPPRVEEATPENARRTRRAGGSEAA